MINYTKIKVKIMEDKKMVKENIYFRKIKKSDYKALEKIIRDTWEYERFCSPKTAKQMAKLYLAGCLADQTFTCVAVNNEEPVGIIMGKNKKNFHAPIKFGLRLFFLTGTMLLTKERRQVSKIFDSFCKLDQSLLDGSRQNFDGELAFFAVRDNQRGTGIGKTLFQRFISYIESQDIKNFYLYTDVTCNYRFYEHQGMKRIGEKKHSLKPYSNEEISFFLYGCNLPFANN